MNLSFHQQLEKELQQLADSSNRRVLRSNRLAPHEVDFASNDYLGLMHDGRLQQQFWESGVRRHLPLSSTSSRLLMGNGAMFDALETYIARFYEREAALFFNSGYHMNTGILPAVADKQCLILADKLVHASLIDGIRLSAAPCIRYRHHDYTQLERLVEEYHSKVKYLFVVTESIFSMDGDRTPLRRLVDLKQHYPNLLLYVDEAHAVGVRGETGKGIGEEDGCINKIDFLCGTCGKALAAEGGFVVCDGVVKDYLINHCRTFIFTTAISPLQVSWLHYVWQHIAEMTDERRTLAARAAQLRKGLAAKGWSDTGESHILPLVIGDSEAVMHKAGQLRTEGFVVQGIRPPTVPKGTARLRISLHAGIQPESINRFIETI